jgi:hypothetical protein
MKKKMAIIALAGTLLVSVANANVKVNANAFIQPFNQSYALVDNYLWFTDIDLTDPTGSYCDIWYEVDRLHQIFPGYQFTPYVYSGLNGFEYGYSVPWYFATIYSDLSR